MTTKAEVLALVERFGRMNRIAGDMSRDIEERATALDEAEKLKTAVGDAFDEIAGE